MNRNIVGLAVIVAVALLGIAAGQAPQKQALAVGELHWTRASVCEHPKYPGLFLQYYLTDECGRELFLNGDLTPDMVGRTIWAEGLLLEGGFCDVVEVTEVSSCGSPDPGPDHD